MKKILFVLVFPLVSLLFSCCRTTIEPDPDSRYDVMYKDSFDCCIQRIAWDPDSLDTLYTEMYIALKSIATSEKDNNISERSCSIVLDRANRLLACDTIFENRIKYREAIQLVYSFKKDYDSFWKEARLVYDEYPANSIERLSSITLYSYRFQQLDSVEYYGKRCVAIADSIIRYQPKDEQQLGLSYFALFSCLSTMKRYDEAADLARQYLEFEENEEFVEMLKECVNNPAVIEQMVDLANYYL